ncbi:MAG: lysophospholipid acyltransferase family protein [Actinomycetota bacterium]
MEPWYDLARLVAIPPVKLWFNWKFEDLDRIPRTGPAIVAANRISYLDPFANGYSVMKAGRRPRFLAKEELFKIPVVGAVIGGAHQIPVKRGSGDPAPLIAATEALAAGEVVVIYPEGTVTRNPDSLPMQGKTGTVRLSLMSGVPVTPMASWGGQAVWQKSGRGSLKFGRPIWVKVGEPMDFSDRADQLEDREALHDMTDELMSALTALALDLRDRYPKRWTDDG